MKKMTNRKLKAIENRKRLFDISLKMINEQGYDNVSIDQICEEAGVSVGTFYNCFKSKIGIIMELYKKIDDYYIENARNVKSVNSFDKIIEVFSNLKKVSEEMDSSIIVKAYQLMLTEEAEYFYTDERPLYNVIDKLVIEGQENGEISKTLSHKEITEYLLIFSRGIVYDWCIHKCSYNVSEKMYEGINIIKKSFVL